jgi:integrase
MGAFGDKAAPAITTTDVSKFLRGLDRAGVSPRTVNKHRQVLSAIFGYATREDTFSVAANPVSATDKRREPPAAALDFFEPEEIEDLARAAAEGTHRKPPVGRGGKLMDLDADEIATRCEEDAQDAELFRVLAYTGLRIGEALALQWGDADLPNRRLIVQRAVSGTVEGPTKGWQVRSSRWPTRPMTPSSGSGPVRSSSSARTTCSAHVWGAAWTHPPSDGATTPRARRRACAT